MTLFKLWDASGLTSGKDVKLNNYFPYFSTKAYVVGTQKNHLNEMVLLSTQNICLNLPIRK